MKRKILKLFLLILFCIPLFKIFTNIDIKAETGSEKRVCSICQEEETKEIPAKEHTHSYEEVVTI